MAASWAKNLYQKHIRKPVAKESLGVLKRLVSSLKDVKHLPLPSVWDSVRFFVLDFGWILQYIIDWLLD